jgi:23S rRNA (guanine2445-N2)-methyltransferase / 23S rRNA (guanine2069-N7)-methyltransferase
VTIDLFEESVQTAREHPRTWLQMYEYAPPRGIDEDLAHRRLLDVLAIAPRVLGVDPRNVYVRTRLRARGGSQYADEASQATRRGKPRLVDGVELPMGAHLIDEGGLTFEVNFSTRLDCGIFLDHRDTRARLREMAKQTVGSKRFLNLFAYTGTATCYAADGGMRHTTTVDLSRPSLDWAKRNMARNGFTGREHEFVQADVLQWVSEQRHTANRWDLIFCDVPTFSNSQRMRKGSFDVQRDHAELLIGVSRLLTRGRDGNEGGVCVFSCNQRTFKPDVEALAKAGVAIEDITAETIPEDFSRNKRIHHCYLVRRI